MKNEAQALAAQQDAARREDDHGPALAMNAEYDRARLQALADQHLAAGRERTHDEQIAGLPAGALSVAALDTVDDIEPTDEEIIDALVEAFGMSRAQCVERLARFDFAAQRELEAA